METLSRFSADEKRFHLAADAITIGFMALIVAASNRFQIGYILFPELAALTSDVLRRPAGKWAKEPWKLVATPTLTAAVGAVITAYLPYGAVTILLSMLICLGVVRLLRSSVSPAISAGILPIVFGIHTWLYPLCVLGTISALAALLLIWKRLFLVEQDKSQDDRVTEQLEAPAQSRFWLPSLTLFIALVGAVAQISQWRFILFPPLVVMSYEMLGHTQTCPWAKPPYTFPVVCAFVALVGVECVRWMGGGPLSAAAVLAIALLVIRIGRIRLPPALAIGLIPFIMPSPRIEYAISVGLGTLALTIWFLLARKAVGFRTAS